MSDDADNFFNGWKGVFTVTNTRKLISSWHIDKSWKKGLHILIAKSKQVEVYHYLRVLLGETSKTVFTQRLQQFISWLRDYADLADFLQYFEGTYMQYLKQWALLATEHLQLLILLESFHRVLKVISLQKQNCRINYFLHILLKIHWDKVFDRLQESERQDFSLHMWNQQTSPNSTKYESCKLYHFKEWSKLENKTWV